MSPGTDGALRVLAVEGASLIKDFRTGRKSVVIRGWDGREKHTITMEVNKRGGND